MAAPCATIGALAWTSSQALALERALVWAPPLHSRLVVWLATLRRPCTPRGRVWRVQKRRLQLRPTAACPRPPLYAAAAWYLLDRPPSRLRRRPGLQRLPSAGPRQPLCCPGSQTRALPAACSGPGLSSPPPPAIPQRRTASSVTWNGARAGAPAALRTRASTPMGARRGLAAHLLVACHRILLARAVGAVELVAILEQHGHPPPLVAPPALRPCLHSSFPPLHVVVFVKSSWITKRNRKSAPWAEAISSRFTMSECGRLGCTRLAGLGVGVLGALVRYCLHCPRQRNRLRTPSGRPV